jgi:hypothetical protein
MPRALVIAARQPEVSGLLEEAGFEVELHTRPIDGQPAAPTSQSSSAAG